MRDGQTNDEQGKIMLLSLWMLEGWVSQLLEKRILDGHCDLMISPSLSSRWSFQLDQIVPGNNDKERKLKPYFLELGLAKLNYQRKCSWSWRTWFVLTDSLIWITTPPLFHLPPPPSLMFYVVFQSEFVSSDLNVCPAAQPLMARILCTHHFSIHHLSTSTSTS